MNKKITCSLDCFDICSIEIEKRDGSYYAKGDKDHPVTKGYICNNGRRHLERKFHKDRLLRPLLKVNGKFEEITLEKANEIVVDKLSYYKEQYGSESIMFFTDCGYGGMSKEVDGMFFDHFGGVSVHNGGLCWSAGDQATKYDFGENKANGIDDLLNSDNIVIWGRNPVVTNMHLMDRINEANKAGVNIYIIDPLVTRTAKIPYIKHIQVKPGTDGALALNIINSLVERGLEKRKFLEENTIGYEEVMEYSKSITRKYTITETGISDDDIENLTEVFSKGKTTVILGYGIQRYKNGGNTVRAINALCAFSGNVGEKGAHVYYNNKRISRYISGHLKESDKFGINKRYYPKTLMADYIEKWDIKCLFITKSNPLVQMANVAKLKKAFDKVPFKIGLDMFMTDTMENCDLVIPCSSILEEEEFVFSSMYNPYLNYSEKVFEKPDEVVSEYYWFGQLAKKLGISSYPQLDKNEFFRNALKKIENDFCLTIENLKDNPFKIKDDIPFEDKKFKTDSGKIELTSKKALDDGLTKHCVYIPARKDDKAIRLLTIHWKESINSQGFMDIDDIPEICVNSKTAKDFMNGERIIVKSKNGKIECILKIDDTLMDDIAAIYQGFWWKSGCVNILTEDMESEMGGQTAYYDTFVTLERS